MSDLDKGKINTLENAKDTMLLMRGAVFQTVMKPKHVQIGILNESVKRALPHIEVSNAQELLNETTAFPALTVEAFRDMHEYFDDLIVALKARVKKLELDHQKDVDNMNKIEKRVKQLENKVFKKSNKDDDSDS